MPIEKLLLIGLAIAGVVMLANFAVNGGDKLKAQTGKMGDRIENVQNGLNIAW